MNQQESSRLSYDDKPTYRQHAIGDRHKTLSNCRAITWACVEALPVVIRDTGWQEFPIELTLNTTANRTSMDFSNKAFISNSEPVSVLFKVERHHFLEECFQSLSR